MDPGVFIIILSWNHVDDTVACLASLRQLNYPNHQIVLVDNASTDDTVAQVRENFPNVHLILNQDNLGFVAGNNVGIRYALEHDAAYICLLNDDTTLASSNLISEMVRVGESDSKIGMLIPSIISSTDHAKQYWGARLDWTRGVGVEDDRWVNQVSDTDFAQGCALLVKAKVVRQIGLLDPAYWAYFEDVDWSIRCKRAGYRVVVVPQTQIYHRGTSDHSVAKSPTAIFFARRNQARFIRKYITIGKRIGVLKQYARDCLLHFEYMTLAGEMDHANAILDGLWAGLTGQQGAVQTTAPTWFRRLARERHGLLLLFTEPFPDFVRHFPWRSIPRALWQTMHAIGRQ